MILRYDGNLSVESLGDFKSSFDDAVREFKNSIVERTGSAYIGNSELDILVCVEVYAPKLTIESRKPLSFLKLIIPNEHSMGLETLNLRYSCSLPYHKMTNESWGEILEAVRLSRIIG